MKPTAHSFLGVTALSATLGGCGGTQPEAVPPTSSAAASDTPGAWVKPPDADLKARLTPLEYEVTRHDATEPPFHNAFWDHHKPGLYVDVASGEPLFASVDKFDSGTGWPSFTRPIDSERIVTRSDDGLAMTRVEVRSKAGDSHLGHVFLDGPAPTGLRYCINSASLRFVPAAELEARGYGAWRARVLDTSASPPPVATENACNEPALGQAPGCAATLETAILAGGCFWGMEDLLRKIPGVLETEVGYTGGTTANPSYDEVHTGHTGHAEAVRIVFSPARLSFADLLEKWFFRMHDPTTRNRQGNDLGTQYRSAIFFTSPEQKQVAEAVRARIDASRQWPAPIVTEITPAGAWTPAEAYHQDYLVQHPDGYTCHYLR